MPPLSMFGRTWRISSDDFVYPAAWELVVRLSSLFILCFVLVFHIREVEDLECLVRRSDWSTRRQQHLNVRAREDCSAEENSDNP